jgi:ABC-2 type transport system ATP-binding protein
MSIVAPVDRDSSPGVAKALGSAGPSSAVSSGASSAVSSGASSAVSSGASAGTEFFGHTHGTSRQTTPTVVPGHIGALRGPLVVDMVGVHRNFGDRKALTDLNLVVPEGAVSVLLGPNGAGKTTAIRMITGALPAHQGLVRIFGLDPIENGSEVRRRCGVVSAKPALYDRLTGRDNLEYSAALYGLDPKRAPIDAAAERFGIGPALREKVGGYSTGMKTRLALTRAILHDPELLLLDEPTSGLDPESSIAVLELIRGLTSEGKTVLMCTHLLLEAEGLADHVVVMHEGTSLVSGHPADLAREFWRDDEVLMTTATAVQAVDLAGLPGVRRLRATSDLSWTFATTPGAPTAPIVAEMVRRGIGVAAVQPVHRTLEDLYFAARGVTKGTMTTVRATDGGAGRVTARVAGRRTDGERK